MAISGTRRLSLLGTWSLQVNGHLVHAGSREERVLALLAVRGPQHRSSFAGALWPDSTEARARANLRTSLVRLRALVPGLVTTSRSTVYLEQDLDVDLWEVTDHLDRIERTHVLDCASLRASLAAVRGPDLLPGWYDDWALFERERLQHRRISALNDLASELLDVGQNALAVTAAEEAFRLEPLLESSAGLLIRAHLDAGNRSTALLTYRRFHDLLNRELGVPPSRALTELVANVT